MYQLIGYCGYEQLLLLINLKIDENSVSTLNFHRFLIYLRLNNVSIDWLLWIRTIASFNKSSTDN